MFEAFSATLGVLFAVFLVGTIGMTVVGIGAVIEAREKEAAKRKRRRRRKPARQMAEVLRPDPRRFMPPDAS